MTDLWPDDLHVVQLKSPVALLQEQAALLGQKTQNLVEARIRNLSGSFTKLLRPIDNGAFLLSFEIVTPTLASYSFRLFTIQYGVELYPLFLTPDGDILQEFKLVRRATAIQIMNETELVYALRVIFNAEKTKFVIRSLLAHAGGLSSIPASQPVAEVDQLSSTVVDTDSSTTTLAADAPSDDMDTIGTLNMGDTLDADVLTDIDRPLSDADATSTEANSLSDVSRRSESKPFTDI